MDLLRHLTDRLHQLKRRIATRPPTPSGVLLVSSGGVGDTILFSLIAPKFAALTEPGEDIHVVVQKASEAVGFLFPEGVKQIPLDYRRFIRNPCYRMKFLDRIFQRNYRIAISTDHLRLPTVDDAIVAAAEATQAYALRPRTWPKHDAELLGNQRFYTRWIEPSPGMAHRMVRWWELLTAISGGANVEKSPIPKVRFDDALMPPAEHRDRPYVVLHPFTSERARSPAPWVWSALAEKLQPDFDIVVSVGPGDLARCPEYNALLEISEVVADHRSLLEKLSLFRGAQMTVSVDTSVMHLAAGSGAPTFCLASAAHVVDSVPYDERIRPENVTFLYQEMDCQGCLGACIHPLKEDRFACVDALTPERVVAAVLERL
jgi:ADP-heptose:LPS heptosyltransferase